MMTRIGQRGVRGLSTLVTQRANAVSAQGLLQSSLRANALVPTQSYALFRDYGVRASGVERIRPEPTSQRKAPKVSSVLVTGLAPDQSRASRDVQRFLSGSPPPQSSSANSGKKQVVKKLGAKKPDQSWNEWLRDWYEFAWVEGYDAFRRLKLLIIDWQYAYELTGRKVIGRAQPDYCTRLFMEGAKRDALCVIPLAILQALPFSAALIPIYAVKFPQYLPSEFKDKFIPPSHKDAPWLQEELANAHETMNEVMSLPAFQAEPPANNHVQWHMEKYNDVESLDEIDMHELANVASTMRNKHMLASFSDEVIKTLLGSKRASREELDQRMFHRASLDRVFQYRNLNHETEEFTTDDLADECRDRCILPPLVGGDAPLSREEMVRKLKLWTVLSRRYGFPTPVLWMFFRPDARSIAMSGPVF